MSKFLFQTTYLFILANDNLIDIEPSISRKIGYLEVFSPIFQDKRSLTVF